ncbi:LicD family protein, partial [bacterium]|nr:LicD family protein [bacterium]
MDQLEYLKQHTDISSLKPATGKLREQQLQLVNFAVEFFNEIKELDIKPFLLCGNLLGHVRHNGFIPWDDDLDFGLIRADYEKLIEYCKKHFVVCKYDGKVSEYKGLKPFERVHKRCTEYPNQYVLEIWYDQLQLIKGTSADDCMFLDFWSFDFFDNNYSFEEYRQYLNKVKSHIYA